MMVVLTVSATCASLMGAGLRKGMSAFRVLAQKNEPSAATSAETDLL